MPLVPAFHSIKEDSKPESERVYHNNTACSAAKKIPEAERQPGTNGYRACVKCRLVTTKGR